MAARYQLVASDLDETLIPPSRIVGQHALDAIHAAMARGVRFVPSTGRNYASIQDTLEQLGIAGRDDQYLITLNGCDIRTCAGRGLHFSGLTPEQAAECFAKGKELGLCQHVYTRDHVWVCDLFESERNLLSNRLVHTVFDEPTLDFLEGEPVAKIIYVREGEAWLRELAKQLPELTAQMDVTYSSDRYLEWMPRGVSKGSALVQLCEMLGIPREASMAIGDSSNDAEMVEAAGLGCGVANASEAFRPFCSEISDAPMDEGVAELIERFVLV